MKKIAFVIGVAGLFVLFLLMFFPGKIVHDSEDLEDKELNDKVVLKGFVEGERAYTDFRIMNVQGIQVVCDCPSFLEKEVEVIGFVDEFEGSRQIRALEIREI